MVSTTVDPIGPSAVSRELRSDRWRLATIGLASVAFCILLGVLFIRNQDLSRQETHLFRTGTHILDAALVELSKLRRDIAWYSLSPTEERADKTKLRFEILWSRVNLLTEGSEAQALQMFGNGSRAKNDIVAVLGKLEPLFDDLDGLTPLQPEAIDIELARIQSILQESRITLIDRQLEQHGRVKVQDKYSTIAIFVSVAATVLLITAAGIFQIRRNQRLLAKLAKMAEVQERHVQSMLSLAESSPSGIVIFEPTGRIRYENETFRKLTQKLGCHSPSVALSKMTAHLNPRDKVQESSSRFTNSTRILRGLQDQEIAIRVHLREASWYGRTAKIVLIQDVTDVYLAQQRGARAARLAALAELSTAVAHQINQPLAIISAAVQNTLRRIQSGYADSSEIDDKLTLILTQIRRATTITDRMRVLGNRAEGNKVSVDLVDCIRSSATLMSGSFGEFNIDLDLDLPPDGTAAIAGHRLTVEHVLLALMLNARDAHKEDLARSADARRIVSISLRRDGGDWLTAVTDNAGGFDEVVLDRAFEPFVTTKSGWQNVGLGLSFCHAAIRDMNGEIQLGNVGDGAMVQIRLPAALEQAA